ncbi:hypothetical protein VTK73DRAFT_4641 [Phialemonium thermophilum]|uniref:Uncharacterized protein n=1 Tax=Phialemonium thermophilum TaxID=223376 RepID=A0ABR3V746_9PEZI
MARTGIKGTRKFLRRRRPSQDSNDTLGRGGWMDLAEGLGVVEARGAMPTMTCIEPKESEAGLGCEPGAERHVTCSLADTLSIPWRMSLSRVLDKHRLPTLRTCKRTWEGRWLLRQERAAAWQQRGQGSTILRRSVSYRSHLRTLYCTVHKHDRYKQSSRSHGSPRLGGTQQPYIQPYLQPYLLPPVLHALVVRQSTSCSQVRLR